MSRSWNLVADIGGTSARFGALLEGDLGLAYESHHSVREYPQFSQMIAVLLAEISDATGWSFPPKQTCFAVACPADTEQISFTNSHWEFSRSQLMAALGCPQLILINDFEAVAHGITELGPADLRQIGGDSLEDTLEGMSEKDTPKAILGPGTGLGVAALVPHSRGYQVVATEGGHADFAPNTDLQIEVLKYLLSIYPRVSLERVLSGGGLLNIYRALSHIRAAPAGLAERAELSGLAEQEQAPLKHPSEVVDQALDGTNPVAEQALTLFCEVLGSTTGNLALTYGARGGVYIAGGVVPRFEDFFVNSPFRQCFENKGRFATYLKPIPVYLVTHANLGLLGAAKKLQSLN